MGCVIWVAFAAFPLPNRFESLTLSLAPFPALTLQAPFARFLPNALKLTLQKDPCENPFELYKSSSISMIRKSSSNFDGGGLCTVIVTLPCGILEQKSYTESTVYETHLRNNDFEVVMKDT